MLAPGHFDVFNSYQGLMRTRIRLKKFAEAETIALRWRGEAVTRFGRTSGLVREFDEWLVTLYEGWNRPDEAAKYRSTDAPSD